MSSQAPSPAASGGGGGGAVASPPPLVTPSPPALSPSNNGTPPATSSPPPAATAPPVSSPPPISSPPPPPISSSPPLSSPNSTSPPLPSSPSPPNSASPPSSSPPPPSSPVPVSSPPPIVSPPVQSPPPPGSSSPPDTSYPPPPVKPSNPPTAHPPSTSSPPPPTSIAPPPPASITPSPPLQPPSSASPPLSPPSPKTPSPKGFPPPPPEAPTIVGKSAPPPPNPISKSPPTPTQGPNGNISNPPPASISTPSSKSDNSGGGGISIGTIGGIAAAGLIVLAVIGILIWFTKKRRRGGDYSGDHYGPPPPGSFSHKSDGMYSSQSPRSDQYLVKPSPLTPPPGYGYENGHKGQKGSMGVAIGVPPPPAASPGLGNSRSWFTYEELAVATNGFARQNLLGEGGFGCVYKGYLPDGQVVAVKQLKVGGGQGEREFRAEVEIISRVHHRHLVSLVGYCIADSQRLLVYDYVPNGTLEHHLHGSGRPVMDWTTRVRIAVGAARGLAYLHEDCHPRIIHRDIKSSNILLDDKFEAQVSDFGLAKLALDTNTHVTTRVMGTFGYMAPEYASSGKLTERSDVFSFGVVLLELVTGRKPVDTSQPLGDESLVEWARPLLSRAIEEGSVEGLADPRLETNFDENEMFRMVEATAACVRHSAQRRPRMGQVVRALESDAAISDLNNGVKPGQSSMYNSAQYSADIRRFRRMAFGSREYSSDYSGVTSEYERNRSVSSSEFHNSKEVKVKPSRNWTTESASGSEGPSSGESETRAINRSQLYRDETSEKSSGEVPINFQDEPLSGR
eukprot:Gb_23599 [translate_table: standard]